MLEHILIKQFVNRLSNEVSKERVILKAPKTLTEAAQFARFAQSAIRVTQNHSTVASTQSTVSSLGFRGRGSSSGPSGFASRGRVRSTTHFGVFRDRGQGRSVGRGAFNLESRASRSGPKSKQSTQQNSGAIKCFDCQKLGYYARDCRSGSNFGQGRDTSKLERAPTPKPSLLVLQAPGINCWSRF